MKSFYVYILTSKKDGVLYVGVTNDLMRRIFEHKNKVIKGFTKKYNIDKLVCYEIHGSINEALKREKQIKKWLREWKINLIEENNPNWIDMY